MSTPSLNSLCPCGSGKKYKRCCGVPVVQNTAPNVNIQLAHQLGGMAIALFQKQDYEGAAKLYEQLISMHPGDSAFIGMRGMVSFKQGKLDEAELWLNKAIRITPNDSRLFNFMGQVQVAKEELFGAEKAFARAVVIDPGFFEAWCNLGSALQKNQQLRESVAAYQKALSLSPNDADIYLKLIEIHYLLGEFAQAQAALDKVLSLKGPSLGSNMWQSLLLRAAGRGDASLKIDEQSKVLASGKEDELVERLVKLANLDVTIGNMEQAEYWLDWAIKANPYYLASYTTLAKTKKFQEKDRTIVEAMELLSETHKTGARSLEFALGKVYNDMGDYERSFLHYQKGNNIAQLSNFFDAAALIEGVGRTIRAFSQEGMGEFPRGSDSDMPILIVGTPRSGTTLTEQIISSHSRVEGAGELSYWGRLGRPIMRNMDAQYDGRIAKLLAEGYLGILREHSKGARHVTDKMPNNFSYLGLIHAVFPNAKIVHCRRHPIDACLSMYFQDFGNNQEFHFSLEGLAVYYEQYLRLMDHWRSVLPPGVMYELQYEQLVEDTEGETRKMMEFLGLELEQQQMEFFKKERSVFTASVWQVRQPIYKTSKDRWRRYEKFIGPLMPLLKYMPDV